MDINYLAQAVIRFRERLDILKGMEVSSGVEEAETGPHERD